MPSYGFKCKGCGATKTVVLRLSEYDNPMMAPDCEHCPQWGRMERQIGSPAIQFKGDGWTPKHY